MEAVFLIRRWFNTAVMLIRKAEAKPNGKANQEQCNAEATDTAGRQKRKLCCFFFLLCHPSTLSESPCAVTYALVELETEFQALKAAWQNRVVEALVELPTERQVLKAAWQSRVVEALVEILTKC